MNVYRNVTIAAFALLITTAFVAKGYRDFAIESSGKVTKLLEEAKDCDAAKSARSANKDKEDRQTFTRGVAEQLLWTKYETTRYPVIRSAKLRAENPNLPQGTIEVEGLTDNTGTALHFLAEEVDILKDADLRLIYGYEALAELGIGNCTREGDKIASCTNTEGQPKTKSWKRLVITGVKPTNPIATKKKSYGSILERAGL